MTACLHVMSFGFIAIASGTRLDSGFVFFFSKPFPSKTTGDCNFDLDEELHFPTSVIWSPLLWPLSPFSAVTSFAAIPWPLRSTSHFPYSAVTFPVWTARFPLSIVTAMSSYLLCSLSMCPSLIAFPYLCWIGLSVPSYFDVFPNLSGLHGLLFPPHCHQHTHFHQPFDLLLYKPCK